MFLSNWRHYRLQGVARSTFYQLFWLSTESIGSWWPRKKTEHHCAFYNPCSLQICTNIQKPFIWTSVLLWPSGQHEVKLSSSASSIRRRKRTTIISLWLWIQAHYRNKLSSHLERERENIYGDPGGNMAEVLYCAWGETTRYLSLITNHT